MSPIIESISNNESTNRIQYRIILYSLYYNYYYYDIEWSDLPVTVMTVRIVIISQIAITPHQSAEGGITTVCIQCHVHSSIILYQRSSDSTINRTGVLISCCSHDNYTNCDQITNFDHHTPAIEGRNDNSLYKCIQCHVSLYRRNDIPALRPDSTVYSSTDLVVTVATTVRIVIRSQFGIIWYPIGES